MCAGVLTLLDAMCENRQSNPQREAGGVAQSDRAEPKGRGERELTFSAPQGAGTRGGGLEIQPCITVRREGRAICERVKTHRGNRPAK